MRITPQAQAEKTWSPSEENRKIVTVSCRDTEAIPEAVSIERDGVTPYELQDTLFRLESWKHAESNVV
jgi:hypothetical protein